MSSTFSHPVVAVAVGALFTKEQLPRRYWLLGAACALLPDIDELGKLVGIKYGDMLGHRGLAHSLVFAATAALVVGLPMSARNPSISKVCLVSYLFLCTVSHGLLDALTAGGLGVAFFAPFSSRRYFFPWRPLPVSPLGHIGLFTPRGAALLLQEFQWIWLPSLGTALIAYLVRQITARRGHG